MTELATSTTARRWRLDRPLGIHSSSWVAWSAFAFGYALAAGQLHAGARLASTPSLVLIVTSVAVFLLAVSLIQRHMGLELARTNFGDPQRLVQSGPFRYSRNPIYAAFLLPLASLAWASPIAAGVAIVVYIIAMNWLVIGPEERQLNALFGPEFDAWKRSTPRWLVV